MKKFFLTGPNRTGTSLLARCIDDHPECICLCESNVQTKAFGGRSTVGHSGRMRLHGFSSEQIKALRTKLILKDGASWLNWYDECAKILQEIYQKPQANLIGDKNPYFHNAKGCVEAMGDCLKIWTIRDPRAVWYSGEFHRFGARNYLPRYLENVRFFADRLDATTLVIRFEDFVSSPEETMEKVYKFLGVDYDASYLTRQEKPYDKRFAWNPNSTAAFDMSQVHKWRHELGHLKSLIMRKPEIRNLMERFGYA